MDVWPGYCEERITSPPTEKGKGKAQDKKVESPWRYPVIDHGSLAAATLHSKRKGKRYEWSFAAGNASAYRLVADSTSPVELFPPTRPQSLLGHDITALQRAEQGAHFLRTYYPDVDIPAELIRGEIAQDEQTTQALKREDVFSANAIAVSSCQVSRKNFAYLVFPMGSTNCQLNMSQIITTSSKTQIGFKPASSPVHTFETPIRQIVASPHTTDLAKGRNGPMLAVRTMGSTHFMQVKLALSRSAHSLQTSSLLAIQRADLDDKHAVDVAISPHSSALGYIANDLGVVFRCSVADGRSVIERVHTTNSVDSVLCRIASCEGREKILATFDTTASVLDLRAGKSPYELYRVPGPGVRLTSIESGGEDHMARLVSTEELLWIDDRSARKPLFAVKHGREFDLTLRSHTHVLTRNPLTFLTSCRNSLVTVYDVARGDSSDKLVHMYGAPYALPPTLRPDGAHLGYAFFQQPTLTGSKHISVFQLSHLGGVSLRNFDHISAMTAQESSISVDTPRQGEWSPEIKQLIEEADATHTHQGPLAGRAHCIEHLGSAYERLFVERKDTSLSAQSNAVFELMERMPSFWQTADVPVDYPMTMFDIAMRSGSEPFDSSRNDWLTGSALDSAAGYRVWGQDRIPRKELIQRSPWHLNILPFIQRHVPEFEQDPRKTLDNLARYDLADGSDRTADSFRRETEARSQLALDLSLATDIFSAHRPGKEATATFDEDMLSISLSTQAMSLAEIEPSPVQFGFLQPIRKADTHKRSQTGEADPPPKAADANSSKVNMPLGVRLLLQEWDLGTDPNQYVYEDPYDDTPGIPVQVRHRAAKEPVRRASPDRTMPPPPAPTHRPPTIASSIQAPPVIAASSQPVRRKPLVAARSQDAFVPQSQSVPGQRADAWTAPSSSQEPVATQVLPGPHGGRPAVAKKKPAKKRVGGF